MLNCGAQDQGRHGGNDVGTQRVMVMVMVIVMGSDGDDSGARKQAWAFSGLAPGSWNQEVVAVRAVSL
jgi:hypothetical protein